MNGCLCKCKDCGETFYQEDSILKEVEEMKRGEIESFLISVGPNCESNNYFELEEDLEDDD